MKLEFSTATPDAIEIKLEASMTISEWRTLKNQFEKSGYITWPASQFFHALEDQLARVEKHFIASVTRPEDQ